MDPTCAFNDLTSFEYEGQGMNGNGSYLNNTRVCKEKLVKPQQVNLFSGGF